ncbi:hypothetical protein ACPVTF_10920 [Geobacillus icigianus]
MMKVRCRLGRALFCAREKRRRGSRFCWSMKKGQEIDEKVMKNIDNDNFYQLKYEM